MSETRQPQTQTGQQRLVHGVNWVILKLFHGYVYTGLLVVAMVEALLSPFFGLRLAIASIGCAITAIGFILGIAGGSIERLVNWAGAIHGGITSLREGEIERLRNARQGSTSDQQVSRLKN